MSEKGRARTVVHVPAGHATGTFTGQPSPAEAPSREFLSVAVRISVATGGKDGFFIQLFPDLRGPQSIYVSIPQLERLLSMAVEGATELEVWAELAKIPLEPLAPARSLYGRLHSLLKDSAHGLRDEINKQRQRTEARVRAEDAIVVESPRPQRDPDAL